MSKTRNAPYCHIIPVSENIVRVVYSFSNDPPRNSIHVSEDFRANSDIKSDRYCVSDGCIYFKNRHDEVVLKETGHSFTEKEVYRFYVDGEPVIKRKQTANGEVTYIENARKEFAGMSWEGRLFFSVTGEERLYGLGQHEDGIYNYNGKKEFLYQTNMKISVPFLLSSKNYAILLDTGSAVIFECRDGKITFTIDTADEISYYVITGDNFDEIIGEYRNLTGRAPMLPRWVFGYIQSKERYKSSEELINTSLKFRELGIPIDCIVQDWYSWREGLWGDKKPDKTRYPDLKGLLDTLHKNNVKLMVSIWPNMAKGGSDYNEMNEKGLFLPNSTTYDAFSEEGRLVYWKQCEEEWFSAGVDAWWCDNSEPFSDPDWNGETKRPEDVRYELIVNESKMHMDWRMLNSYGLFHAKGIYENWRRTTEQKRVVNLTRSSYIGGQRYGVICWSGDITAKWSTLRKQITEGIKFCMSGMPYWTLDIGGFFTVKDKWENRGCNSSGNPNKLWFWDGDYNDGVNDLGYRELYVRWLQYATFLPVFRSHGTDTPREPWNFGEPGTIFYDTILKFIRLRYKLLPYIYSLAAEVTWKNTTMMRSLMFDFSDDPNVRDISDCFMFGRAFLVCPVTEPMYYDANSVPLKDTEKTKTVYLPAGTKWYDFWTNKLYNGGRSVTCNAELDIMPLFVRAGSIVPVSDPVMYADERNGEVSEILVYSGEDGEFVLYNDEGDNYSYENGNFAAIRLQYDDSRKTLTFGKVCGKFKYQEHFKVTLIGEGESKTVEVDYRGEEQTVSLM